MSPSLAFLALTRNEFPSENNRVVAYVPTLRFSVSPAPTSGRSFLLDRSSRASRLTLRRPLCRPVRNTRLKVVASAPPIQYEEKKDILSSPDARSVASPNYRNVLREILVGVRELARPLYGGKLKVTAWLWTAATVLLALAATLYAVMLSMIQRFFWNSLNARDASKFGKLLLVYGIAVVVGPFVISTFNWIQQRLALMWRSALTDHLLQQYFANSNYYKLSLGMGDIDNPDQRISEDVMNFTSRAVRFITVIGVGLFDLLVFSVLLYKIYKPLLFMLIGYSAIGTIAIGRVGRHLLVLNREQASREADYRFGLVRVRDSTENIAFYGGEDSEEKELFQRFGALFRNKISLLGLKRIVELMSSSFRYWAQIAPTILIAPQYFAGKLPLGALSQVYFSFNHVLSSLGLVVSEFTALAEFGAGIRRLKGISDALKSDYSPARCISRSEHGIDCEGAALTLHNVSVYTPTPPHQMLVRNVTLSVERGERLLVVGRSGIGKSSLMRAISGLWNEGEGSITRPPRGDTLFLPQRAFVMLGSLRDNVIYPSRRRDVTDDEVVAALKRVNLGYLVERVGLDAAGEALSRSMSLGEQQRLAFSRILISKPYMVVLDESTSALDMENERDMYGLVRDMGLTCVSVGNRASLVTFHDRVLRIEGDSAWMVMSAEEYASYAAT
ncbi:unnamed protein product [Agarophyton chilense]|eukprot:gb/GEZJ01002486.1/.p1 GENE.gb/GEZJ01002486.1/~~gb/GEZJ01002486.1/.p1  ORF type:complete len:672 (-),score=60.22 gb/GEZJ01002486.1/:921-2936(-)